MVLSNRINEFRRAVMHSLTEPIGSTTVTARRDPKEKDKIKRILISRPNNRLGNLLLITPLVQEITSVFPDCKIDLFVRGGHAKTLFSNYTNIDRIISLPGKPFKQLGQYLSTWLTLRQNEYDLVINVDGESASGKLSTRLAKARHKIFATTPVSLNQEKWHLAKQPIFHFRAYLDKLGIATNPHEIPNLNIRLSESELDEGRKTLSGLVGDDRRSIAIFTYATGAKRYSEQWWTAFYDRLLQEFKGFNIIEILPAENVSQIGFKAPVFYSKDVRQIAALLAHTAVFVGADSGIMHLSSASGVPTIGLFAVSDMGKYQPYGSLSQGINTNLSSTDECMRIIRNAINKH